MAAAAARSRAGSSRRPRRPRQISSPGSPVPSLGRLCRRPPPWRNAMHRCVQHPDLTAHTLTLLTACTLAQQVWRPSSCILLTHQLYT